MNGHNLARNTFHHTAKEKKEKSFSSGEVHKRLARASRYRKVPSHGRRTGVDGNDILVLW